MTISPIVSQPGSSVQSMVQVPSSERETPAAADAVMSVATPDGDVAVKVTYGAPYGQYAARVE